jgi:hypothetical protein
MTHIDFSLTRRSALFATVASLLQTSTLFAGEKQVITVHKDPACGCCSGWVEHLQQVGFRTNVLESRDLDAVKTSSAFQTISLPATRRKSQAMSWKDTFLPPR